MDKTTMTGMVIVGGGKAGARAAVAFRENGYEGPVTMITDEIHAPYDRPPLSKVALTSDAPPAPPFLIDAATLASINVSLITGSPATSIDRKDKKVTLKNGQSFSYEKLLLTTGAVSRRLNITGANSSRVLYLRSYEDALALRMSIAPDTHLIIVGGGFIGLEVAASARKRGAKVTLIEGLPRVLSRGVPEEIAEVITARHLAEGVNMHCNASIASFEERDDQIIVLLNDGREIIGDTVLVGIGAIPVSEIAETAGLRHENGISVDEFLQTSDEHIYAAGDCVSFPLSVYGGRRVRLESWRSAQDQGALAAANMLGGSQPLVTVPWFWSDQYDLTLQIVGLQDEGNSTIRRDLNDNAFILFHLAAEGRLVAASGIGNGNAVSKDIRLAEMIIAKGMKPLPNDLADPTINLKRILAS